MGNTTFPKFINGEAGQQVFAKRSKVDMSRYPVRTMLKSWLGACYGIYQYEDNQLNPTLLDKLKLVHVEVGRFGPVGLLISMVDGSCTEVTCIPCLHKNGHEVVLSFPQRTYFEKTVMDYGNCDLSMGISCCLQIYHKQRPDLTSTYVPFMDLWGNVKNRFTDDNAFIKEVARLKEKVILL